MKWLKKWFNKPTRFSDGLEDCKMTKEEYEEAINFYAWNKYRPKPEEEVKPYCKEVRVEQNLTEVIVELHNLLKYNHEYWVRHKRLYVSNKGVQSDPVILAEYDHNIQSVIKMNEILVNMYGYEEDDEL